MTRSNSFQGFDRDSFQLFRDLAIPENNNRVWFDANRERYQESVVGRMKSLLETMKPLVLRLNPHFDCSGKTNGNFSRINRDIRFSKDKSPYKLNYYLYFFDKRRSRDGDSRLYVGLSGEGLTMGFSIYGVWRRKTGDVLETVFKKRLAREKSALESYLKRHEIGRRYESYWYSLVEKEWTQRRGLPKSNADWKALRGWVVRRKAGLRAATAPAIVKEIQDTFKELFPLYVFTSAADGRWRDKFLRYSR